MRSFQTVKSETIYQGKVFDVRQDQVRLPNGNLANLDIVEHSGAVTLLPVDNDRQMWFVRQYRHPARAELIELPAGVMEQGETPEACAHREIREEHDAGCGGHHRRATATLGGGSDRRRAQAHRSRVTRRH
ncbi:MAG: NUDIX domain-containing protein [Anaerolineales bacterium]